MKKRMKKVATLCLAGVTAMSTVGVTGSAVFAKGDTNYDVEILSSVTWIFPSFSLLNSSSAL